VGPDFLVRDPRFPAGAIVLRRASKDIFHPLVVVCFETLGHPGRKSFGPINLSLDEGNHFSLSRRLPDWARQRGFIDPLFLRPLTQVTLSGSGSLFVYAYWQGARDKIFRLFHFSFLRILQAY